jgi:hypothetical protein
MTTEGRRGSGRAREAGVPQWEADAPSSTVPHVCPPPLPPICAYNTLPVPPHRPPSSVPSRADAGPLRHVTMPPPRQHTAADKLDAATSHRRRRARRCHVSIPPEGTHPHPDARTVRGDASAHRVLPPGRWHVAAAESR